jgi:hypothetical protein
VSARRRVPDDEFAVAYAAWPGSEHDKTTLKALLLRYRIEAVAARVPCTVVPAAGTTRVPQRLLLTVGEPGLDDSRRLRRLAIVRPALAAYHAICDVLHGRDPEGRPALALVAGWEQAVVRLEQEFPPPDRP